MMSMTLGARSGDGPYTLDRHVVTRAVRRTFDFALDDLPLP